MSDDPTGQCDETTRWVATCLRCNTKTYGEGPATRDGLLVATPKCGCRAAVMVLAKAMIYGPDTSEGDTAKEQP